MKMKSYLLILTVLGLSVVSCRSVKEVEYFQASATDSIKSTKVVYPNFPGKENQKQTLPTYISLIQPHDILSIYVTSLSPEASSFFNTISQGAGPAGDDFSTRPDIGYLVDPYGYIEMPLVGKVKLSGLTTQIARDTLTKRLEKYLQVPSVRVYIVNFKVTVLGEVNKPGVYNVTNEKINLPEAIALAGDLSIYGNRKEVMLIREVDGEKTYSKINLTTRELFNSPSYYLHSNDILYVPPVKAKVAQTDNFYRIYPIVISTLTFVLIIGSQFIK